MRRVARQTFLVLGALYQLACSDPADQVGNLGSGGNPSSSGGNASTADGGNTSGGSGSGGAGSTDSSGGQNASSGGAVGAGGSGSGGAPGSGGAGDSVFPEGVIQPKIMIVGDSISAGPGCYKGYLDQKLKDNGYSRYEFVGEYSDDCGKNVAHSAVSCTTSLDFTKPSFTLPDCKPGVEFPGMASLVAEHDPDLIMLQLGVNDVWGGSAPIQGILTNYSTLLSQARAHNPQVVLVVAQIHKIITDNCTNASSTTNAEALIQAVPDWAASQSTQQSPVFVADLWTNSDPQEADDCVHPDDAGAKRMGDNWYEALKGILPK